MLRVLVPVKTPTHAKQRLSAMLDLEERRELARVMALDLLTLLTSHPSIGPVTVCGNDASTKDLARTANVEYLPESELSASGLSPVVNAAATRFAAGGEVDLLVIHGDVPLLTHTELERFLARHREAGAFAVTIAPDRWRGGTNLMAWRPIERFTVQYGIGSFERHCQAACEAGAQLSVCELEGAGVDVDEPDDVKAVIASADPDLAPHTLRFLREPAIARKIVGLRPQVQPH